MSGYSKGNDYRIEKLDLILDSGDRISLLDLFVNIRLHQDIFVNPSMYCVIRIGDSLDLYSSLPIKNNETLEIEFYSPDNDRVNLTLKLFSREDVMLGDSGRTTYYDLKFISPESIVNTQIKDSRSYTGSLSDIAGSIWSKHFKNFKPLQREQTEDEYTIVLPFNNPFAHLHYLAKKSKRKSNPNDCNFFFFENFRGWNFVSAGNMLTQSAVRGYFSWEQEDPQESKIDEGVDLFTSRFRIKEVEFVGKENFLDESVHGVYSGYMSETDVKNKKTGGIKYNYEDAFSGSSHANDHPLTTSEISSSASILSNYGHNYSGIFSGDIRLKRKSQINALLSKRVRFLVSGSSSTNVGDKIKLEFMKQRGRVSSGDIIDNYRSGFYIVTSVKHNIEKGKGYTMTVEACTDSYSQSVPTVSNFKADGYPQ